MLYLLPGMGTTSTMYDEIWRSLSNTVFLDWPLISGPISMESIARTIIEMNGITSDDYVGGSSLGGMIAIEIARILSLDLVILIGSAKNRDEINQLMLKLAPLADITPIRFAQVLCGKGPGKVLDMFSQSDTRFIRETCKVLPNWNGLGDLKVKIIRIHGKRDLTIKCPKEGFIISKAGHLIAMTHSTECVQYLREVLRPLHQADPGSR